jgi:hypothetical protein
MIGPIAIESLPGDMSMPIPVNLTPAQEEALRAAANRLGVPAEELARIAVEDLLEKPAADFSAAADLVLRKNHELYQRLAK